MANNDALNIDLQEFAASFKFTQQIKGAVFLITGATGLIGSTLCRCLLSLECGIKIIAPVRNLQKAKNLFIHTAEFIEFIDYSVIGDLDQINQKIDYIIHCASPTDGTYMVTHPVETFELSLDTMRNVLTYSKNKTIKSIVYISSIEYYGQNFTDESIKEDFLGYIDYNSSRSSYPLSKRATEFVCKSYAQEYDIPVKIARLTQTFGAGVSSDDNRVFAQFARSIIQNKDIELHTTGNSAKPYCYTIDCINAILHILLLGKKGEAYNVANSDTYISIKNLAIFLKDNFNPHINISINIPETSHYAPETKLNLDTTKLMQLGWEAKYNLKDMYERLIHSINH